MTISPKIRLKPDYFTCSSPSHFPYSILKFQLLFSLLPFCLSHSPVTSSIHPLCLTFITSMQFHSADPLSSVIVLSSRPFLPPFHNLSIVSEMNTALFFSTLSSYRHPHHSLSLLFLQKDFCLTFISPPPLFPPVGPERRLFLLTESSLDKKKRKNPDNGIRAAQPLHVNV